jgi:acyl-CoA dehydrogenase
VAFYNCPTDGEDVELSLDAIIGGTDGAGRGWAMLMDALSAGRGIMLPAQAVGGGQHVTRVAGAHAAVRKQFGLSIGKFEGIEEPLARIAGQTYIMDAARNYTNGAVDQGEKPAVVSAIPKYNTTDMQRDLVNDGMDILAGNGISRGPNNLLGLAYQSLPISVTVEGANILTRTMMIFGQGAIRCHPYALREIEALMEGDVGAFDDAFWSHVGHVVRNGFRAFGLSLTRGRLARSPVSGPTAPHYRKMAWASASFAFFADLAMGSLGGLLKRKEKITGRFADILSWMYLGTAVLTRFEKEGRPEEQEPFLHWSMQYAFAQMQEAFDGLFVNLKVPGLTWLLRTVVASWSRLNRIGSMPDDDLGGTLAQAIQKKEGAREWLTENAYVPDDLDQPLGELERAFRLSREAYHVGQKIKDAVRQGELPKERPAQLLDQAVEAGVISEDERDVVHRADEARERYIQVDEFDLEEYRQNGMLPGGPTDRGALDSSIVEALDRDPTQVEVAPHERGDGAPPRGDGAPTSPEAGTGDASSDRSGPRETA